MVFIAGINSGSEYGMGMVIDQKYKKFQPLKELAEAAGGNFHAASASGVVLNPDGQWFLKGQIRRAPLNEEQKNKVFNFG